MLLGALYLYLNLYYCFFCFLKGSFKQKTMQKSGCLDLFNMSWGLWKMLQPLLEKSNTLSKSPGLRCWERYQTLITFSLYFVHLCSKQQVFQCPPVEVGQWTLQKDPVQS